jgi:hypothetical protein
MVNRRGSILFIAGITLMLASCDDSKPAGNGPITLGDSSSIVTESDEQQLKDLVTDLQPVIPPSEGADEGTAAEPAKDTTKTATTAPAVPEKPAAAPALPNTPGMKAEFGEVTVMLPGIEVKQAGNKNLQRANGAVYTLVSGSIEQATLRVSGNVTKVSQRYHTVVIMKSNYGPIPLEQLSVTTRWEQMKGGNNAFPVAGLDTKSLEYYDADASDIRNAVQRAAQRRRLSRKKVQELVSSVRNVRSANQKPMTVVLRSVMWKVDGKDQNGRTFSKQIRIDVPL